MSIFIPHLMLIWNNQVVLFPIFLGHYFTVLINGILFVGGGGISFDYQWLFYFEEGPGRTIREQYWSSHRPTKQIYITKGERKRLSQMCFSQHLDTAPRLYTPQLHFLLLWSLFCYNKKTISFFLWWRKIKIVFKILTDSFYYNNPFFLLLWLSVSLTLLLP